MTNQKDELPETSIFRSLRSHAGSAAATNSERSEPGFSSFNDSSQEEYEEPERDTDYFSAYNADDELNEEEQEDLFSGGKDEPATDVPEEGDWSSHTAEQPAVRIGDHTEDHIADRGDDAEPAVEEEPEDPEWLDEEDEYEPEEVAEPAMPLRLIAVAVVALLLLTVGAYGVLQERAAMQEQLRELRASLATGGASESDLVDSREALRELQAAYDTLQARSSALSRENNELKASVAALEAEQTAASGDTTSGMKPLVTQEPVVEAVEKIEEKPAQPAAPVVVAREEAPPPPPALKPAPAQPPAPAKPAEPAAAPAPPGNWFVNFGSYASRDTAEAWAKKLSPVQGEVVVVPTTKNDRTYYRVRVISLSGKNAAELVARQLEAELQVSRLWVGQQ